MGTRVIYICVYVGRQNMFRILPNIKRDKFIPVGAVPNQQEIYVLRIELEGVQNLI